MVLGWGIGLVTKLQATEIVIHKVAAVEGVAGGSGAFQHLAAIRRRQKYAGGVFLSCMVLRGTALLVLKALVLTYVIAVVAGAACVVFVAADASFAAKSWSAISKVRAAVIQASCPIQCHALFSLPRRFCAANTNRARMVLRNHPRSSVRIREGGMRTHPLLFCLIIAR